MRAEINKFLDGGKLKNSILFIGDIVGEPGLNAVRDHISNLIEKYEADFVIANGENVTNGKGITKDEAEELFKLGVDVITTGNHIWDNWHSRPLIAQDDRILRPYNYPQGNPGRGYKISQSKKGNQIAVVQLQGRSFMYPIDCPFKSIDYVINNVQSKAKVIIVDFHAEATAEKIAMGWHTDGRISALLGTHTHVQTADACLLPNGTAYITDVGMTGPYDSVLGLDKSVALKRFTLQTAHKYKLAENDVHLCGVHLLVDSDTGQALKISSFIIPEFEKSIYEKS